MNLNDYPRPWHVGTVYEHRADIVDARGAIPIVLKVPGLTKDIRERAESLVAMVNSLSTETPAEPIGDIESPPEEPPDAEPKHGKKTRKH